MGKVITLQSRGTARAGPPRELMLKKTLNHLQTSVEALAAPDRSVGQNKL